MSVLVVAISTLEARGQGDFHVTQNSITCTKPFMIERTGSTLTLSTKPTFDGNVNVISGSTYTCISSGGISMINGVTSFSVGGDRWEVSEQNVKIGGVRYHPYRRNGKKYYLPEGFQFQDNAIVSTTETATEPEEDPRYKTVHEISEYSLSLTNISSSGQAKVAFGHDVVSNRVTVTTSGQSSVYVPDGKYSKLTITTSGQSSVKAPYAQCENVQISTSGQSSVNGFRAQKNCIAHASGQSSIRGSALKGCDVDKNTSGQASINISKVFEDLLYVLD